MSQTFITKDGSDTMTDALLEELKGETLWLTLNRPNELNAMNKPLVNALRDTFEALKSRHDVRIVVLQAKGKAFCAGTGSAVRKLGR